MKKTTISVIAAFIAISVSACSPNAGVLKDGKPSTAAVEPTPMRTEFEREMSDMRSAGFQSIYVIRRKDGKELSSDDRAFLKQRSEDANRRVSTDAGKTIIIGMNRPPVPENISAIYDKFAVEAFNQPPPAITATNSK